MLPHVELYAHQVPDRRPHLSGFRKVCAKMNKAVEGFDVTKGMVPVVLVLTMGLGALGTLASGIWWASSMSAKVDMLSDRLEPVPAMLESSRSNSQDIEVLEEKMMEVRQELGQVWEFWRVDTRNMQTTIDRLTLEIKRLEEEKR